MQALLRWKLLIQVSAYKTCQQVRVKVLSESMRCFNTKKKGSERQSGSLAATENNISRTANLGCVSESGSFGESSEALKQKHDVT